MAELPHSPKRKRPCRKNLESRYFPSPKRQKPATQNSASLHLQETAQTHLLAQPCWTNKSRFFPPSKVDLNALLANPAFLCFYEEFLLALHELYMAKPILIQGRYRVSFSVLKSTTYSNIRARGIEPVEGLGSGDPAQQDSGHEVHTGLLRDHGPVAYTRSTLRRFITCLVVTVCPF